MRSSRAWLGVTLSVAALGCGGRASSTAAEVTLPPIDARRAAPAAEPEAVPGALLWSFSFRTRQAWGGSAALDLEGNVLWIYPLSRRTELAGRVFHERDDEDDDTLVAKMSPAGDVAWMRALELPGHGVGSAAIDAAGGIVIGGEFWGVSSRPTKGAFLARLSSSGDLAWIHRFEGQASGGAVSVDARGTATLVGDMWETVDFGGGPVASGVPSNRRDGAWFFVQLDSNGKHLRSMSLESRALRAHAFAPDGALVVVVEADEPTTMFGHVFEPGSHLARVKDLRVASSFSLPIAAWRVAASNDRACIEGGGAPLHSRGVLPSRIVLQCYDDAGHVTLDRTLSSDGGPTHHHDVNIEKFSVDAAGRVHVLGEARKPIHLDALEIVRAGTFIAGFERDGAARYAVSIPCSGHYQFGSGPRGGAVLLGSCNADDPPPGELPEKILARYAP